VIKIVPPNPLVYNGQFTIFLAGSIEMGKAEPWQDRVIEALSNEDVTILNPRRPDWDSSWKQSIDNTQFRGQVEWELGGLMMSDLSLFYFDPNTMSPITLFELGLQIGRGSAVKKVVCCPDGYWRKGNIDVSCTFFTGIDQVGTLEELIEYTREQIHLSIPPFE